MRGPGDPGFEALRQAQLTLGRRVREVMAAHGYPSVAAPGFQAAGVVVSYTGDADMQSSKAFLALGLQTASGVPLQCDEGPDFRTFRIGLFGLEKLGRIEESVRPLEAALRTIERERSHQGLAMAAD